MEEPVRGVAKDAFDSVTTRSPCRLIPFFLFLVLLWSGHLSAAIVWLKHRIERMHH